MKLHPAGVISQDECYACSLSRGFSYCHRELGWEAATERFLEAAEIGPKEWPGLATELLEGILWGVYKTFTGQSLPPPHTLLKFCVLLIKSIDLIGV